MQARRVFPFFIWVLAALLLTTGFSLPTYFDIPYPAPLGPQFDALQKLEHLEYINRQQPEMVLIGDSQLYLGVDELQLASELGQEVYKIAIPGSGSAVWYLLMKNSIVESAHTPRAVVVTFRDTLLTVPGYRTTGRYFDLVDDYTRRNEPVLLERAYLNEMGGLEKAAQQFFPLYSARREIREGLDRDLRYRLPGLAGCDASCADRAFETVFGRERLDPAALSQAIDAAQQSMFTPRALDFERQVERSFLPEIIRLAEERSIRLVFVRLKTQVYPTLSSQSSGLRAYAADLEVYLQARGTVMLDFSTDERLQAGYFFDEMHFNAQGKQAFTHLLAEALRPQISPP